MNRQHFYAKLQQSAPEVLSSLASLSPPAMTGVNSWVVWLSLYLRWTLGEAMVLLLCCAVVLAVPADVYAFSMPAVMSEEEDIEMVVGAVSEPSPKGKGVWAEEGFEDDEGLE